MEKFLSLLLKMEVLMLITLNYVKQGDLSKAKRVGQCNKAEEIQEGCNLR